MDKIIIENKIALARKILRRIGMPNAQQADICALTLLAMAGIKPNSDFTSATNEWKRIHDVILFLSINYDKNYAENSRETFRKQAMHHFRTAAIIEDNGKATNSPHYRYRITSEFLSVLKTIQAESEEIFKESKAYDAFIQNHELLKNIYASKKEMEKMPVKINSFEFTFSPGKHNELQKAIIEEFAPLFAPNSECLYVGDTIKKDLVKNEDKLRELGFDITLHDKMPDVVLYREDKDWLYFIESVTSVGPMNPKRIEEIKQLTAKVKAGKIFITAFLDFKTYKKFSGELSWETEVWLAEEPKHMIHLNGDKFLGPR